MNNKMKLITYLAVSIVLIMPTNIAFSYTIIKTVIPARHLLDLKSKSFQFNIEENIKNFPTSTRFTTRAMSIPNPYFIENDYSEDFLDLKTIKSFELNLKVELFNYDKLKNTYVFNIEPLDTTIILTKQSKSTPGNWAPDKIKEVKANIVFGDGEKHITLTGQFKSLSNDEILKITSRESDLRNYDQPIITNKDAITHLGMIITSDIPITIDLHD